MNLDTLLHQVDAEIARLQNVRALLAGEATKNGKPKTKKKKWKLSKEARERMASAMKRRWREKKKAGKTSLAN